MPRLLPVQTNYPDDENFAGSTVRSRREGVADSMNQKRPQTLDRSQDRLGTRWYFGRVHYGIRLPAINSLLGEPCRNCRGSGHRQLEVELFRQLAVELHNLGKHHDQLERWQCHGSSGIDVCIEQDDRRGSGQLRRYELAAFH